jgi:cyanophycinase-like exopeptidase
MAPTTLSTLAGSLPRGLTLIGVDEDTALVRFEDSSVWQVMGRQNVSVIDAERGRVPYAAGATIQFGEAALG